MICPCGEVFQPSVFNDRIQLLCDGCAVMHYLGHEDLAPCWISESNVISLFRSATGTPVAVGIESGVVGGEVGGVTPVPLLHPLAPGSRRG